MSNSSLFSSETVKVAYNSKKRCVTFTIDKDTLLVPFPLAEKYMTDLSGKRFKHIPQTNEYQTVIHGFLGTDMMEWEFVIPEAQIEPFCTSIKTALTNLYRSLN